MNHNPLGIFSILLSLAAVATAGAGFYQIHVARFDFTQATGRFAEIDHRQERLSAGIMNLESAISRVEVDITRIRSEMVDANSGISARVSAESAAQINAMNDAVEKRVDKEAEKLGILERQLRAIDSATGPLLQETEDGGVIDRLGKIERRLLILTRN